MNMYRVCNGRIEAIQHCVSMCFRGARVYESQMEEGIVLGHIRGTVDGMTSSIPYIPSEYNPKIQSTDTMLSLVSFNDKQLGPLAVSRALQLGLRTGTLSPIANRNILLALFE